jgi:hypothetical protein
MLRRGSGPTCLGTQRLAGDSRRERVNRIGDGSARLGPRPGRRVEHRSVPPAHGGAWTLWTKRGRGLRFRLRSTEAASQVVFGSTGMPATPTGVVSVRRRHEPLGPGLLRQDQRSSGGRQRQEGKGRSDAVRLSTRGMLRRVRTALRGTVGVSRPLGAGPSGSEASERVQAPGNAANPVRIGLQHARAPERSKPSRW